jgi:tetratricopeptide (TPR) repeat protein
MGLLLFLFSSFYGRDKQEEYGVLVSIPDEVVKFLEDKNIYGLLKSGNYEEFVGRLEKVLKELEDSTLLLHLYLMCGTLPHLGTEKNFNDPKECKKRIFYLEKVVSMTDDKRILGYAYGNLVSAYGGLKDYDRAIFCSKKMVDECQGIGEVDRRNAVAITGVGDAYNYMT